MDQEYFWLNDAQFERLELHLKTDTRDKPRGDKGYDTNAVRRKIEATGAAPNIPPKSNRV